MHLTKKEVDHLVSVTDKDWYLRNIKIEPGRLVATDGKILLVKEADSDRIQKTAVVEGKKFKDAVTKVHDDYGVDIAVDRGGGVHIEGTWETVRFLENGETFPPYEKILKKWGKNRKNQQKARFDPGLLIKILKAMGDVEEVTLKIRGIDEAARIEAKDKDGRELTALIMPIVDRETIAEAMTK